MVQNRERSRDEFDRGLPRGPHTLTRGEVLSNQRQRLVAAMGAAVGERGYANTTVADVIAAAGVSRKAFYEHFANREECFLDSYDAIVADMLAKVTAAYRSPGSLDESIAAAIEALFQWAVESPLELRAALIEIGALGQAGARRREQLIGGYEALLRESIGLAPGTGAIPNPVLRAIVGGVGHVLFAHVRAGRERRLQKLVPDLVSWIGAYHSAPAAIVKLRDPRAKIPFAGLVGGRAPGSLATPGTPSSKGRGLRGEHVSSRSFVVHSQRERILDAVASQCAEKGYTALTVKDIAARASVSLDAFYEHYAGKEDAFLVAYEVGHGKALTIVERAYDAAPDWRRGVRAAIAALFDFLASEPAFAHVALLDAPIATARAAERASRGVDAYAQMLMPGLELGEGSEAAPAVAVEAILGGVLELCRSYALQGRTHALSELLPRTIYFVLAPFLGAEEAGRLAMARPPA